MDGAGPRVPRGGGGVVLQPIDRGNWRDTLEVRVDPDQLRFVADHQPVALVVLAKSYVRPDGREWCPFAILDDRGRCVGVMALACSDTTCELFHFVVDCARQRRGLGTAAMAALVEAVKRDRPACSELTLTVHPDNEAARRLYCSAGFEPTGEHRHGEPVWTLSLRRSTGGRGPLLR